MVDYETEKNYIDWEYEILGPIGDKLGVEQGCCASDRLHKLTNNEQLLVAQRAGIGACLGVSIQDDCLISQNVGAIGLADDATLMSNTICGLRSLLELTKQYCQKYHVELVPEKN